MKILLVEDDSVLANSMVKLIKHISTHEVTVTTDPQEIIDLTKGKSVDLILMDISLPGMQWQQQPINGLKLAKLLKGDRHTQKIPIIMLSAYVMNTEADSMLSDSGADDFLPKPISDYTDFINKIESYNCARINQLNN